MKDQTKGAIVAVGIAITSGLAAAAIITGSTDCSPTTTNAVVSDLGPGASCALPIIVNGLVSGQEIPALIALALQCGGETVAGLIALVVTLESTPEASVEAGPAPAAAAALAGYRVQLAALHTALLARQAAGAK